MSCGSERLPSCAVRVAPDKAETIEYNKRTKYRPCRCAPYIRAKFTRETWKRSTFRRRPWRSKSQCPRPSLEPDHFRQPRRHARRALWLGHWFGTDPQFWPNLQSAYDTSIAAKTFDCAITRRLVWPIT